MNGRVKGYSIPLGKEKQEAECGDSLFRFIISRVTYHGDWSMINIRCIMALGSSSGGIHLRISDASPLNIRF